MLLGLALIEHDGERCGVPATALHLGHLEGSRPGPLFGSLDSPDKIKADLIAVASHQLRTPLAIIKGCVDAFLAGELQELGGFQASRMGIIDARVDQMTGIINDLLDLVRASEQRLVGERHIASSSSLVESEVEALRVEEAEAKELDPGCRIEDGLPGITVDADHIRPALQNILDNAIMFAP